MTSGRPPARAGNRQQYTGACQWEVAGHWSVQVTGGRSSVGRSPVHASDSREVTVTHRRQVIGHQRVPVTGERPTVWAGNR